MNRKAPPPGQYSRAADKLRSLLESCVLCPQKCRANRLQGETGLCGAPGDVAQVASCALHHGEEPPISGSRGSGTVFFEGCTLNCRFCQNYDISQGEERSDVPPEGLAAMFLELQLGGAHNINLVTPTPHIVTILDALAIAREHGLNLPIVYNTSGYELAGVIARLDGLIEIYMPDYKYGGKAEGQKYSDAQDYPRHASAALEEMYRQVGNLDLDEDGVVVRGVMIRHLVMPGGISHSPEVIRELRRICGPEVYISLMAQYHPAYRAHEFPELSRRVSGGEYDQALRAMQQAGITRGYAQAHWGAAIKWRPEPLS